jgi:cytochrome c553
VQALRVGRRGFFLAALFISTAFAQGIEERLKVCAGCHGADGNSALAGTPSLAGQPRIFLENYLVLTREGLRGTKVMQDLLKGVKDPDIVAMATHYSKLAPKASEGALDKPLFVRGKAVAAKNRCGNCHLPDFRGREQMPRLAGQREDFLAQTMLAYQQNKRPGGDTIMAASLYGIAEADVRALAHYLARLR